MSELSEIKISLENLAKFCAAFDEQGKNEFPEGGYEGKVVFGSLYWTLFKKEMPPEIEKEYFDYDK